MMGKGEKRRRGTVVEAGGTFTFLFTLGRVPSNITKQIYKSSNANDHRCRTKPMAEALMKLEIGVFIAL